MLRNFTALFLLFSGIINVLVQARIKFGGNFYLAISGFNDPKFWALTTIATYFSLVYMVFIRKEITKSEINNLTRSICAPLTVWYIFVASVWAGLTTWGNCMAVLQYFFWSNFGMFGPNQDWGRVESITANIFIWSMITVFFTGFLVYLFELYSRRCMMDKYKFLRVAFYFYAVSVLLGLAMWSFYSLTPKA
jgi:hypothetical protein